MRGMRDFYAVDGVLPAPREEKCRFCANFSSAKKRKCGRGEKRGEVTSEISGNTGLSGVVWYESRPDSVVVHVFVCGAGRDVRLAPRIRMCGGVCSKQVELRRCVVGARRGAEGKCVAMHDLECGRDWDAD